MPTRTLPFLLLASLLAALLSAFSSPHSPLHGHARAATTQVQQLGSLGGWAYTIVTQGTVAYVGDQNGLTVLDISSTERTTIMARLALPDKVRDIQITGEHAYLATGLAGLTILDVRDPARPLVVGTLAMPGHAVEIEVVGKRAYSATHEQGVQIIDVAVPEAPVILGRYNVPLIGLSMSHALQETSSIAYVTTSLRGSTGGVQIVDLRDPVLPVGRPSAPAHDHT